jgi:16S rRNA (cytosine1402-N4)-methyltransferase
MPYHIPVLSQEVLKYLSPEKGKTYVDSTLGDGGHTLSLLEKGAQVLGIDYSEESLDRAKIRIEATPWKDSFTGALGNFKNIDKIAEQKGFSQVDGVIFDLGFSSSQLEDGLGLSFNTDVPLDMRLDKTLGVTAADIVNTFPADKLAKIFYRYSGERMSRRFANAIAEARNLQKLQTTKQLAELLESVAPPGYERGRIHPATRVFQALRIIVNDELENLKTALPRAARILLPGGRMIVISFHSLEDKLAKEFGHSVQPALEELTAKPVVPSEPEIATNVRSRSAKMRVFEKTNLIND